MKYLICIMDFYYYLYLCRTCKTIIAPFYAYIYIYIYKKEKDRKQLQVIINKSLNGNLTV